MAANARNLTIRCDGTQRAGESEPAMGHPAIFLVLSADEEAVSCSYCGQRFEVARS